MCTGKWVVYGALVVSLAACGTVDGGDDTRDAGASDAQVAANLTLSDLGTSAGVLDPPFQPEVLEYDLNLYYADAEISLTPSAADAARSTITVAGETVASGAASTPLGLDPGSLDIAIVVSSGGDSATYNIRARRGVDALASLELSYGDAPVTNALVPAFEPATTSYALDVGLWLQQVQVSITPLFPDATVTIDGSSVATGDASPPIALNLGQTSIPIVVSGAGGPAALAECTGVGANKADQGTVVGLAAVEAFRCGAATWPSVHGGRTARRPASAVTRPTIALHGEAPSTSSLASAQPGCSRPTSRPPTPTQTIASAKAYGCGATPWPWAQCSRRARRPGSAATRPTTAPPPAAPSTSSVDRFNQ